MQPQTDEHLVLACLRKNGPAQQALYVRYGPYTLGICRRHSIDLMEAEDMHQVGWLRTFDKLSLWKEQGPLRAWLRRLFVNVSISAYQKRRRKDQWLSPIQEGSPEPVDPTPWVDFAAQEHLLQLIAALPDGARIVFNLFAVDGYSHAEIAILLGITEGNSRQQLLRARNQLAKQLQPYMREQGDPNTGSATTLKNQLLPDGNHGR